MSLRLALCLLLLCISFPLMARDMRQMGPNGDSGGDPAESAQHNDESTSPKGATKPLRPKAVKAKPTSSRGGSDTIGDVRPPRWHSFLPGMFR